MGATRGKVILLEMVLRGAGEPDLGKLLDIAMLALPGGASGAPTNSRRSLRARASR
jgi:hypothetical protein